MKRLSPVALMAVVLILLLAVPALAVPANDNFGNATALYGNSGSVSGTNVDATVETDEPLWGNVFWPTVWYKWTPSVDGRAFMWFTPDTSFDTILTVYTGTGFGDLQCVAQNDDGELGYSWRSAVNFAAVANTTYYIQVAGGGTAGGAFVLDWNLDTDPTTPPDVTLSSTVSDPTNTSPIPMTATFTKPVTGFQATDISVLGGGVNSTTFSASGTTYTFDVIPDGEGLVTIGVDAEVAQDGFGNLNTSATPWSVTYGTPPANDDFADAGLISGNSGFIDGDNRAATTETGDPVAHVTDFNQDNAPDATLWYKWQAPANGSMSLQLPQPPPAGLLDGVVAVYTGNGLGDLAQVEAKDDTFPLIFSAVADTWYYVQVGSCTWAYASGPFPRGTFTLSWEFTPDRPANDDFANAQKISGASGSVGGDNTAATAEPGETKLYESGQDEPLDTVWYAWTAPANGDATFEVTAGTLDTVLGVYTGAKVDALTLVAWADEGGPSGTGWSKLTTQVRSGTTYYVRVDGYGGSEAPFTLVWSLVASAANDDFAAAEELTGSSVSGNNTAATVEPSEPLPGDNPLVRTVWYWWTAPRSGSLHLNMTSAAATLNYSFMAVYTGDSLGALEQVAYNDGGSSGLSELTTDVVGGTTYHIQVGSWNLLYMGTFTLAWDFTGVGDNDTDEPTGTILLDSGNAKTFLNPVPVDLTASDATSSVVEMRFSTDKITWSDWQPYEAYVERLLPADGLNTLYVQFKDEAGNVNSDDISDSITLDTTGPSGTVSIDGGADYAKSTGVTLTISATDTYSSVAEMNLSNDGVNWAGWVDYATSYPWILAGPDGANTVCVKFVDNLANYGTAVASDSITLDTVAPTVALTSSGTADPTNAKPIPMTATFDEAVSGFTLDDVTVGNGTADNLSVSAMGTATATTYTFDVTPTADGKVTVDVVDDAAYDAAGNGSTSTGQFSCTYDGTAPTGASLLINGGLTYTVWTGVGLTPGASGATWMRFQNAGGSWTDWEKYASSEKDWLIDGSTEGLKTVNAEFKDDAGNTVSASDSITFDELPPTDGSISIEGGDLYTNKTTVTLTLFAKDDISGVSEMSLSNTAPLSWGGGIPYATSATWSLSSGDGEKTVYVQFLDNASNYTAGVSASITLDTVAPTGQSLSIESGATYTTSENVTLALSATGADWMHFSNDGVTWSDWEGYGTGKEWVLEHATDGSKTVYAEFEDNAGNSVGANATIVLETSHPSLTLSSTAADPTNAATIPVRAEFSEPVIDFDLGDVKVVNGSAGNLSISILNGGGASTYTFDVTPSGQGPVTVDVDAGAAWDLAGNGNTAATQLTRTHHTGRPTLTLSSTATDPTSSSPIPVTATFDEAVTGFAVGDITVGNGSVAVGSLSGSGTTYTFNVTPSGNGVVTVDVAADVAQDAAGNGNTAAPQLSRTYSAGATHFTITASAGAHGTISPRGTSTVNRGASKTFTITPASGYHIKDVVVDGTTSVKPALVAHGRDGYTYTFTNVQANRTIVASFESDNTNFTIQASVSGFGGTISPSGNVSVHWSRSVTFAVTPSAGFHVDKVLVDGVAVTLNRGKYTFTNVTAAHTIVASFAQDVFVEYYWGGFLSPLSNSAITSFNRGSTILVKFRLLNAPLVTDAMAVLKVAGPSGLVFNGPAPNAFAYDPIGDSYSYRLRTTFGWHTGVYTLTVTLDDGTSWSIRFRLR